MWWEFWGSCVLGLLLVCVSGFLEVVWIISSMGDIIGSMCVGTIGSMCGWLLGILCI